MRLFIFTTIIGALTFFASCDLANSNSDGPKSVAVNMQVQSSSQAKYKAVSPDSLTEIKLLVEELELESVNDDSSDFEVENQIVNIPVNGDSVQLTTQEIPSGLYDEFNMEIENDEDGNPTSDPDFSEGENRYSIVVKGFYNGEEFTFRADEDFEIELNLNPPLEISETTSSAAINIRFDPSGWFIDNQGNPLDPNDETNWDQIEENIENSVEAEGEEDEDEEDENEEDNDDDDNENEDD